MIIPSANDNWIVVGPGRTGSKVIADAIVKICRQLRFILELKDPTVTLTSLTPLTIYHSHNCQDLQYSSQVSKCILSTRDLVDSALSWCIQPYIGEWHLYPLKHRELKIQLEKNIPAFHLKPALFMHYYEWGQNFYRETRQYDLSNVIIIDYKDFQYDHTNIAKILDYPIFPIKGLPVKNPGTPSQWITNWSEIKEIIKPLERDPKKFLDHRA
jgi:hypothetical protein